MKKGAGRSFITNTLLIVFSLFFALTVFEVLLRIAENVLPDLKNKLVIGWKGNCLKGEQNQLGFRGRSISYTKDDLVVLLVGDSYVQAGHYPFACMPETVLEYYLNGGLQTDFQTPEDANAQSALCTKLYAADRNKHHVKVFSVGADGYGQDQEYIGIIEYFETYKANMTLLWFTPTNDIWNNLFPTHFPGNKDGTPKPTFILKGNTLIYPDEALRTGRPFLRLIELYNRIFLKYKDKTWETHYLPKPYEPLTNYHDSDSIIKYDFPETENLTTEKSHIAITLTPRSERMNYGIRLTNRLIKEIESLTVKNGSKFVTFWDETDWGTRKNAFWYYISNDASELVFKSNGKYYKSSKHQYDQNISDVFSDIKHYRIDIKEKNWFKSHDNPHLSLKALDECMHKLADKILRDIPAKYHLSSKKTIDKE
ncbi:hypothetical protein [Candidatus Magnetomonas plexicatena]|uniref:hypothetical protein n=1 Tax=Candidatus Magnetomonas plexicatena TaxID=2552947 RepID=UPI001C77E5C8|nr:hypothetical protein E2O03_015520 [Nitrospirales bacterium LBB_01]